MWKFLSVVQTVIVLNSILCSQLDLDEYVMCQIACMSHKFLMHCMGHRVGVRTLLTGPLNDNVPLRLLEYYDKLVIVLWFYILPQSQIISHFNFFEESKHLKFD
jgi:hypothetical protein